MKNLMIPDHPVLCDECKRKESGIAFIEDEQNNFCLKCAVDLNILTEGEFKTIKELGINMAGGRIEKAIQKALEATN